MRSFALIKDRHIFGPPQWPGQSYQKVGDLDLSSVCGNCLVLASKEKALISESRLEEALPDALRGTVRPRYRDGLSLPDIASDPTMTTTRWSSPLGVGVPTSAHVLHSCTKGIFWNQLLRMPQCSMSWHGPARCLLACGAALMLFGSTTAQSPGSSHGDPVACGPALPLKSWRLHCGCLGATVPSAHRKSLPRD